MVDRPLYIAGEPLRSADTIEVKFPYTGEVVARVAQCGKADVDRAIAAAVGTRCTLTRHERAEILSRTAEAIRARTEEISNLITSETGLCVRETKYEVGRALDVLKFSAIEALHDDGEAFACDVSPAGKARRIFTMRQPVACVGAITPFNHPLNTVVHKVAPAVAVGAPMVLKPSEKTPLAALLLAEIMFAAGLPKSMLSVVLGPTDQVASTLVQDQRVECLTFTGSTHVGLLISETAGYKRLALELGGNSELIVLPDADLDLAARLACEGAFRNSGQRCTAAKRLLVEESIADDFTRRVVALSGEYLAGDPRDAATRVGTVIDEAAAIRLEGMINDAVTRGATLLHGGARRGAQLEPTVLSHVPRNAPIVCEEAFGPIAKIMTFKGLDDAISLANSTIFGLSAGVVTNNLAWATRLIHEIKTGTVNVNEVPGYRTERSPFGGVKMSGLGVKEGVAEACKWMTNVKTFSLPW
jgi:phosphonoacetaldehyde dehydrogenase